MKVPTVIAHRGSSARAPENTNEAFDAALEDAPGAGLEIDVQISADGVVYVLHDETVDRTTDGRGPLRKLRSERIGQLDAGYRFTDERGAYPFRGRGIRIPRLRHVLRNFPDSWLSIDLKRGGPDIETAVVRILDEEDAWMRCVVGAEHEASARRLRRLLPDPARCFFDRASAGAFYLRHRLRFWAGYDPPARSLQIPTRVGRWRLDRRLLVEDAHRRDLVVIFWTVDEEPEMRRLLDLGADALITNRPDRLRRLLDEGLDR